MSEDLQPARHWWKPIEQARVVLGLVAFALLVVVIDQGPIWPSVLVSGVGEALQWWSAGHLRKNVALAASGPYALVRNPMYIGRFLVGLGFALSTRFWPVTLVYVLAFAAYAHARVLREEGRLQRVIGEPYLHYSREVPRWLPRLTPWSQSEPHRISWQLVRTNHQHRVTVALALAYVILWGRVTFIHWRL